MQPLTLHESAPPQARVWCWLALAGLCLALLPSCASADATPDDDGTGDGGLGGSDSVGTTTGGLTHTTATLTTTSVTTAATSTASTTSGVGTQGATTGGGTDTSGTDTTGTTGFGFGFGNADASASSSSSSGSDTTTSNSTDGGTAGSDTTSSGTTGSGTTGGEPLPKFVGNITTGRNVDSNGRTFSTYWDQITPENAGKWGSVQSNAGSAFNWTALDAIYDYAQSAGIIFKQHTFVWGSQQPGGNIGESDVKNWMQEFCARYPNTPLIDVVNEPPPHTTPAYANSIGGGTNGDWQWIVNAFNWAHEACPNSLLILNDFNNIEWGDQNQHFIDIVKTIQNAGAPIDAVGAQAHGLSSNVSTETMKNLITKLHNDTGLPVYITEYDINQSDDQAQLGKFQEHLPFFLETEWIHGITIWGWIYGSTWVASSGLIRNDAPRPAMTWLMQELGRPQP